MKIIGIAGLIGSGKDTLAQAIVRHNPSFTITHFAKLLKDQAGTIFRLSKDDMYTQEGKMRALSHPIHMDDYVEHMSEVTGLPIQRRNLVATSPREILQYYGTEYVRSVAPNYWSHSTVERLADDALVPDTRFANEAKAIWDVGGTVIRVVRDGKYTSESGHASEAIAFEADKCLHFNTGVFDAIERAAKSI